MILTTDEARTLNALRASGRRLVRTPTDWRVHARGDARTRPLAILDLSSAARLVAAGRLCEAPGGGLILASDVERPQPQRAEISLPDASFFVAIAARNRPASPGFIGLARKAEQGHGPLSRRAVRAGLTLIKDAEAAIRQSGLTMDFTAAPQDRDARRAWRGGGVDAGARARAALRRLRSNAGESAYALGWSACVDARSLSWLAARHSFPRSSAAERLAAALETLADAYGL